MRTLLRGGWALLSAAGFAAAVAGMAGRHVPPRSGWVLQLVALALPPAALGVAAATGVWAVLWVRRPGSRTRQAALVAHTLLCSALVARFAPAVTPKAGAELQGPILTLLSANLGPDLEVTAFSRMRDELERVQPDMVALQEAPLDVYGDFIAGRAPVLALLSEGTHQPVFVQSDGGPDRPLTQPVFVRGMRAEASFHPLNPQDEARGGQYVRAEVEWEGVRIAVYNVHLRSFDGLRPWRGGRRQWLRAERWQEALSAYREDFFARAAEAERLAAAVAHEQGPVIVAGDLNSTPHQWVYNVLRRSMLDTFEAAGRGAVATFPAARPLVRIDYVLASAHWHVVDAWPGGAGYSDHRPVVARLTLRTTPTE